jgi:hypothetical protein
MESDIAIVETSGEERSYVDWPAIIAGIVFASALSILFLTFGSAVGLSFTNFNARPDVSPIFLAIAAASWLLWVQVSSFMAGAYLTGRLRKRHDDATEEEVDIRDGAHGLLVWGGALVVGAFLAVSGIGAAASAVGSAAATVTNAASNVAGGAAEAATDALDPNAYFIDMLFRAPPATDAGGTAPATEPAATTETPATSTTTAATTEPAPVQAAAATDAAAAKRSRDEATRIFAQGAITGSVSDDDRTYLGQIVAENTGLSTEEASARVEQVMTAVDTAKTEAAEAAETARKTAVLAAFLIAASLLVSAAAAWWAAQMGGNHRDENTVFPGLVRRRV